ncbi:serine/threonine protein kinase [bacterium]|nr:serine/threonine protein kinase [bacterium]
MIGRVLAGEYEIVRELGRGGMGVVYLGRQRSLDRPVAVKVLPPSMVDSRERRALLLAEARLLARLSHPGIVGVIDVLEDDGVVCLVMEYVEGETARDWLGTHGPDPRRAVAAGVAVCRALETAHGQTPPIIHRDVSSANLVFTPRGEVKLLDFGLAALSTRSAEAAGSAPYLSPEQAQGSALDARSDLYSLGVVLYELSTGHPPFGGGGEFSIAYRHVHEPPPPPSAVRAGFPPDLERIILKCLEKQPENRYRDARQLRQALESCVLQPAGQGETASMKRIAVVVLVGVLGLAGLAWYLRRPPERDAGTPAAPALNARTIDEAARQAILAELTALRDAYTWGDVEGGCQAAARLSRADLAPLDPRERTEYSQLRFKVESAQKKIAAASELAVLAHTAQAQARREEALLLARRAFEQLNSAVEDVSRYTWQNTPLGIDIVNMLAALEPPGAGQVASATWEAALLRAQAGGRASASRRWPNCAASCGMPGRAPRRPGGADLPTGSGPGATQRGRSHHRRRRQRGTRAYRGAQLPRGPQDSGRAGKPGDHRRPTARTGGTAPHRHAGHSAPSDRHPQGSGQPGAPSRARRR